MKVRLKELRVQKNLTQVALAEMVNVSRQTIISIETGRYIPSVVLSLKIGRCLGKRVEDIFILDAND